LYQIVIAIFLILASFAYDGFWAVYTHRLAGQDLATELSGYTGATFTIAGAFVPSVVLAVIITICTGISEEVLIRGALQPVFGIVPSALLQGMLHAQIAHTPAFIIKVTAWSIFLGLVKRYTNTTTTIVAHAGLNLVTILLFAVNP
jgi:membrane protease YdiL (CAAX protease family)